MSSIFIAIFLQRTMIKTNIFTKSQILFTTMI